jgi:lipoprotein signal peptidase
MSFKKIRIFAIFLLIGSFFVIDRTLKAFAFANQSFNYSILKPWIGWEYFENRGIAFGIPIPWYFACLYTPVILFIVWHFVKNKISQGIISSAALLLITLGAISNLFDRIYYHFTIDYVRIYTSLINIADIMIVLGAGILVFKEIYKVNKNESLHPVDKS